MQNSKVQDVNETKGDNPAGKKPGTAGKFRNPGFVAGFRVS